MNCVEIIDAVGRAAQIKNILAISIYYLHTTPCITLESSAHRQLFPDFAKFHCRGVVEADFCLKVELQNFRSSKYRQVHVNRHRQSLHCSRDHA